MLPERKIPITFDLTHLEHRSRYCAPTGIERVDLSFGQYFAYSSPRHVRALHYGFRRPIVLEQSSLQVLVEHVRAKWGLDVPSARDSVYARLRSWLNADGDAPNLAANGSHDTGDIWPNVVSAVRRRTLPYLKPGPTAVPYGSIYINVAQHSLESGIYFRWLEERRDLHRVFFVHDLLPMDYPEFWPKGHEDRFLQRLSCIINHATAIITSSNEVRHRIEREYRKRSMRPVPILALPFAPHAPDSSRRAPQRTIADTPYFVIIGTLEPRKNHLFVLNVWRQLAETMKTPPRLIIVGKRSWSSEAVVDMIQRSPCLRSCVCEVYGLGDDALRQLLSNARALLMPSFAEGFGIPVIEALSLGVPVIASDIPIFYEVTKGAGTFLDPLDGPAWVRAISALASDTDEYATARSSAKSFHATTPTDYFREVEDFLSSLSVETCQALR